MRFSWQIFAAMIFTVAPSLAGQADGNRPLEATRNFEQAQANAKSHFVEDVTTEPKPQETDTTDLFALMSGSCSTLKVADRDFACRTVAYAHSIRGRAYFTITLDDPADHHHIISFSGENGRRTDKNLYELPVDRMLLNSKNRPKVDGLPVPVVELSAGICTQLGNFAAGQVSSIACSATDNNGRRYEMHFESDGSPITVRRVRPGPPTIRQHG
ncbi:MAG TPA: hypothetical protein VKS24_15650 [Bradyrhizobium sp.]|nr:hypothetical protein [Bradyrhizobium sp.]